MTGCRIRRAMPHHTEKALAATCDVLVSTHHRLLHFRCAAHGHEASVADDYGGSGCPEQPRGTDGVSNQIGIAAATAFQMLTGRAKRLSAAGLSTR